MRNRFDSQLAKLDDMLIHMGELCEMAITNAAHALKENDLEQAHAVMEADEEIDQMEKDVERLCMKMLLQQQPVAKDLRRISAALKMITDMERIGDQTADIAEIVMTGNFTEESHINEIDKMAGAVRKMVRQSVKSYVDKDLELAKQVQLADENVDESFDKVRDQLIEYIKAEQGQHSKQIFNLIMITKYLERIGDHAANIAEWVEFSITGVHKNIAMS